MHFSVPSAEGVYIQMKEPAKTVVIIVFNV